MPVVFCHTENKMPHAYHDPWALWDMSLPVDCFSYFSSSPLYNFTHSAPPIGPHAPASSASAFASCSFLDVSYLLPCLKVCPQMISFQRILPQLPGPQSSHHPVLFFFRILATTWNQIMYLVVCLSHILSVECMLLRAGNWSSHHDLPSA